VYFRLLDVGSHSYYVRLFAVFGGTGVGFIGTRITWKGRPGLTISRATAATRTSAHGWTFSSTATRLRAPQRLQREYDGRRHHRHPNHGLLAAVDFLERCEPRRLPCTANAPIAVVHVPRGRASWPTHQCHRGGRFPLCKIQPLPPSSLPPSFNVRRRSSPSSLRGLG